MIEGAPTEFAELNEKRSVFDIRFRMLNPLLSTEKLAVNLYVDIEPQKNYRPGYPVEKRGLYYLARSISAQLGVVTEETDYGKLEKCYSIWICRDRVPIREQLSLSNYQIENNLNIGNCAPKKEDYDLLQLVIIRLGKKSYQAEETDLFEFLTAIFYPHNENFWDTMKKYIDFTQESSMESEVENMKGFGMAIFEDGVEVGIERGMERGIEALIETCAELNISKMDVRKKVAQKYALSDEKAYEYVERYWN